MNKLITTTLGALLTASLGAGAYVYAHGVEGPSDNKSLKFFHQAQKMDIPSMDVEDVDAFFTDIVGSERENSPISCGLFKIEKGKPLVYEYDYDDVKMMLEGQITFSDGERQVTAHPGDVLYFPKGSTITFSTKDAGLAFACGQRDLF